MKDDQNRVLFDEDQKTHDVALRNKIVENNLSLADILIRKYENKGIERDDLFQVASMALVLAVERFDPGKGYEFSSFATPTIIGEIKRYFRDKGWAVKVPRKYKELAGKIPEIREELEHKLGRTPTLQELSENMHISQEDLIEAMESSKAYGAFSLQQTFDESDDGEETPALEKYAAKEESGYRAFEDADFIRTVVKSLDEQAQTVFRWRFLEEKTQQEIADKMGISQMSVSRIEKRIRETFKKEFY